MDGAVLRWTKGKKSLTTMLTGLPLVILSTVGANTGITRNTLLAGFPDDEKIILIPTSYGSKKHPDWYHNLRAHPNVHLQQNDHRQKYIARIAESDEREKYWQLAVYYFPGYMAYEERSGGREIPIILLEPES